MSNKGVSFIIASYNCKPYVEECFNSIFNQTYKGNIEIVVCDDCSTDGTQELLQYYADQGKIVLIKNEENQGAAKSRNNCIKIASYDYLAILDADDYISDDRIEKQMSALDQHPDIDFVSTGLQRFYEDGERINFYPQKEFPIAEDFLFGLPFPHATTLFKKEIVDNVGGYRIAKETRRGQDYDLFMRLYGAGAKGMNLHDITYFYRCFKKQNKRKSSYKVRIDEAIIRYKGFKGMKLGIKAFPFVLKPLILGLIPQRIVDRLWHHG